MKQSFFVYLLQCSDKSYYVGHTNNLEKRVKEHNLGRAAIHTRNRCPVKLVYSEKHENENVAILRERQLKRWTRVKKEALINEDFGNLKRLSKKRPKLERGQDDRAKRS